MADDADPEPWEQEAVLVSAGGINLGRGSEVPQEEETPRGLDTLTADDSMRSLSDSLELALAQPSPSPQASPASGNVQRTSPDGGGGLSVLGGSDQPPSFSGGALGSRSSSDRLPPPSGGGTSDKVSRDQRPVHSGGGSLGSAEVIRAPDGSSDRWPSRGVGSSGSGLEALASAAPMTRDRVVEMTDRIWAKVAQMEQHAATMQSDVARLKADARLSLGHAAAEQTGGELVKEQLLDLSTRLDDLQASHEAVQSQVSRQQDLERQLLAVQEDMGAEIQADALRYKGDFQAVDTKLEDVRAELTASLQGQLAELTASLQRQVDELTARLQAEAAARLEVPEAASNVTETLRLDFEQKLANMTDTLRSDSEKQLSEVREQLQQHSNNLEEVLERQCADHSDLQQHMSGFEEALLGLDKSQEQVRIELEAQKRCEETIEKTMQDIRCEFANCVARADLEAVSAQQGEFQETIKELEDDLALHRDASSATNKEVTGLSEAMLGLNERQTQVEARGRESMESLEELMRKSLQQGQQLLNLSAMVQEGPSALISRTSSLEGRTGALEDSSSSVRDKISSLDTTTSNCSRDVQRLASESSEGVQKERSRARTELAAAIEKSQSEAKSRFEALDNWRNTVDQHEVAFNEHLIVHERRHATQDQRLTSHHDTLCQLVERCKELPQLLEARVAEARAAAKEDLTASTLTAFQGEMALMAKVAQLSSLAQSSPATPPGFAFDGRGWQPAQPLHGQQLLPAQGLPTGMPFR